MRTIISAYEMGDMKIIYHRGIDRKGNDCTGMLLIPSSMEEKIIWDKEYDVEPLVQMKIVGDDYPFNYSQGRTMRNSQTGLLMRYVEQRVEETEDGQNIVTILRDSRGLECEHYVKYKKGNHALRVFSKLTNRTGAEVVLEMISSFTMGGLTPFEDGPSPETMKLYQIRSTWANEGRLTGYPIEEFQLEPSWKPSGANGIRFGQVGSMPNREYFPFAAVEDGKNQVCWGAQLAIGSSWQMEAYRKDDALSLSGGIADREKGHWMKKLANGEQMATPEAIITTVRGNIDQLCQRITECIQSDLTIHPAEKEMPVLFNEFCTTWGNPDDRQIRAIVDLLAGHDVKYFVIDAGWDKKAEAEKDPKRVDHGDWICSTLRFPKGMADTVDYIHKKGMKAGIWYEFENCGRNSESFTRDELLYKRDGYPITAGHRRFFNMLDEKVWEYLDERVMRFLRDNGFDYLKVDYNANLGIGPEGKESMGETLYESVLATQEYYRHLKEEIPGLMIENCSAGGHRLVEPFLHITDMSSYSDAHECSNIPLVSANMHRMIPVRQSQIWAVLHPEFSDALMYYKLTSTFLGRMCLSGNVEGLSAHQWEIIDDAVAFYHEVSGIIESGISRIDTCTGLSYKEPTGYQVVQRQYKDELLVVIHTFEECPASLEVELADRLSLENEAGSETGENAVPAYEIQGVCSRPGLSVKLENNKLKITGLEEFDGLGVHLKKV